MLPEAALATPKLRNTKRIRHLISLLFDLRPFISFFLPFLFFSIGAFKAAIVRAVWSSKMPLANAPAVLNLLDGPVGVDPAFHIVWS